MVQSKRNEEQDTLFAELDALMGLLKDKPEAHNSVPYADSVGDETHGIPANGNIPILDEIIVNGEEKTAPSGSDIPMDKLEALLDGLIDARLEELRVVLKTALMEELDKHRQV